MKTMVDVKNSLYRSVGSFFMVGGAGGGGLSKNVGQHGWPIEKNVKKTLAKTPFSSLPKNEI